MSLQSTSRELQDSITAAFQICLPTRQSCQSLRFEIKLTSFEVSRSKIKVALDQPLKQLRNKSVQDVVAQGICQIPRRGQSAMSVSFCNVPIHTIAEGVVVYARTGCPSSTQFSDNTMLRECGAGWGNHLVIDHGSNIYSRYGHMRFDGVYKKVGEKIDKGEIIGLMGNSGRSEGRHLHLEIGYYSGSFDSCKPSQSFDYVLDPASYGF